MRGKWASCRSCSWAFTPGAGSRDGRAEKELGRPEDGRDRRAGGTRGQAAGRGRSGEGVSDRGDGTGVRRWEEEGWGLESSGGGVR